MHLRTPGGRAEVVLRQVAYQGNAPFLSDLQLDRFSCEHKNLGYTFPSTGDDDKLQKDYNDESDRQVSRKEEDDCTGSSPAEHWALVAQLGQCEDKNLGLAGRRFALPGASSSRRSSSDVAELARATNVCARSLPHRVKNLAVHSNE